MFIFFPGRLTNETSLEQQVQHKLLFIKAHIPRHTRLILVSHSIGCFINLRLLPHLGKQSYYNFFLFPTIERLSSSFAGRIICAFSPFFFLIRWLLLTLVFLLSFLSTRIQSGIIRTYFGRSVVDECVLRATTSIFDTSCVDYSFTLGQEELKVVKELDKDLVEKHIDRISFYYGWNDHWCPIEFGYNMKRHFPSADVRFCENKIEHAFVLRFSDKMAAIVNEWFHRIHNAKTERRTVQNGQNKTNTSETIHNVTLYENGESEDVFRVEKKFQNKLL